jgi:hypothetical protein
MPSSNMEFFDPLASENRSEWEPAPNYPEGGYQKMLYKDDDRRLSRFLRVEPGVKTENIIAHDYYEEVLIIEGGLIDRTLNKVFTAGMYAYRTPGMDHGPYDYPIGCLMFEHRWSPE